MRALLVIDVQNEFSKSGKRSVSGFDQAIVAIQKRVSEARQEHKPIAWIRHFNKPTESKAFEPGTWGSEFVTGFGPSQRREIEKEFHKNVYGAFTGSDIQQWLREMHVDSILIVGFYTHGCVSTTAREAIMRDIDVYLDSEATGACEISDEILGHVAANEVKRSALLHLVNMGAHMIN
jgi:nicotinamidase-related amidase